jgi:preprotein translocase subunit SecG
MDSPSLGLGVAYFRFTLNTTTTRNPLTRSLAWAGVIFFVYLLA